MKARDQLALGDTRADPGNAGRHQSQRTAEKRKYGSADRSPNQWLADLRDFQLLVGLRKGFLDLRNGDQGGKGGGLARSLEGQNGCWIGCRDVFHLSQGRREFGRRTARMFKRFGCTLCLPNPQRDQCDR